jgi:hypothetical protein
MLKNLFLYIVKFIKTKVTTKLALVIFVLAIFVILPFPLLAGTALADATTNLLTMLLDIILSGVGAVISLILNVLINIAQFNDFTSAQAVETGWVMIRDICNMFFIVILLVISVGTVLGIQSYSYKNFLKKVIIMAILINFSKTIAGFLIDVSQVVMLTFVSAFKDSITVGFSEAFGINRLKSLASTMDASGAKEQDNFALLLGMMFGLVLSIILLLVLVAVVVMLAYRIVILWILVVLSPLAYLASAMPGSASGQAKQWWSKFTEQLIVGPAIAFFLWLTLSVVAASGGKFTTETSAVDSPSIIGGQLASAPFLLNYILGILLLLVGMQMAQQMGGKSGAAMGKVFNKGMSKSIGYVKRPASAVYGFGKKVTAGAVKGTLKAPFKGVSRLSGLALRGIASGLGAKEDGRNAGSLLHLAAARSADKKFGRSKARSATAKKILEKTIGTGDSAMEALSARGQRRKQKKVDFAVGNESMQVKELWRGNKQAFDENNNKISSEALHASYANKKNTEIRESNAGIDTRYNKQVTSAKASVEKDIKLEASTEWESKKNNILEQVAIYRDVDVNDLDSEVIQKEENKFKGEYRSDNLQRVTDAGNSITREEQQVEYDVTNRDSVAKLGREYVREREGITREKEERDYKVSGLSKMNPMLIAYGVSDKETEDKQRAVRKGRIFAKEPDRFVAGDIEDNIGDIKSKSTKAIFKDMTTEQVERLVQYHDSKVEDTTLGKGELAKANKNRTALYKALRHLSEDKNVDNAASKYYSAELTNKDIMIGSGASSEFKKIGDIEIKKSDKDFMTDAVTENQIINTGYEIEKEIGNLKPSDTVKNAKGEAGWHVDQDASRINESSDIVLQKGTESQDVTKDEFIRENSNALGEHYYNSDRYKRKKSSEGDEDILSQEQYNDYSRISQSSQSGVTTGSLARGGNMAVANFEELSSMTEGGISGVQRKAGMFVQGDDAIKAADAMKEMLTSQITGLETADTDDDIRVALDKFGVKPSEGADLQKMKQTTIEKSNSAVTNLEDEEKIKNDGLIIINKSRQSREARGLIRHEKAHNLISSVDQDGAMQNEIWSNMDAQEKEQAREYVRTDRNQPDISEEEIKKEYIADAFANSRKPGGLDKTKPQLPSEIANRFTSEQKQTSYEEKLNAFKTKTVNKGETIFSQATAPSIGGTSNIHSSNSSQESIASDKTSKTSKVEKSVGGTSSIPTSESRQDKRVQSSIKSSVEPTSVGDANVAPTQSTVSNVGDVQQSENIINNQVNSLRQIISANNISLKETVAGLQALQKQIEVKMPDQKERSIDNNELLEGLRGLIARANETSSDMTEEDGKIISGQINTFLSQIPPEMLDAGRKREENNKRKKEINE